MHVVSRWTASFVGWIIFLLVVVAVVSGSAGSVVRVAGSVMHTTGVVVGAVVTGIPNLIHGYDEAKHPAPAPKQATPDHKPAVHQKVAR